MKQNPPLPSWFNTALENTRKNYRRIDFKTDLSILRHVATDWIDLPKQKGQMSLGDFRSSVYPFCACAQAIESERLENILRPGERWADVASWYHEKIAKPESDEHREYMLRGYPTRK